LPSYDGGPHSFTTGFYAVQELNLRLQQATTSHPEHRLMAFVQYGYADPQMSIFGNHVGVGIVWPYPFGRTNDSIGAGATLITFGHCPGTSFDYDTETAFEFYYKFRVNRFLSISPGTQFVRYPGGMRGQANALVFTPRVTVTF